MSGAAGPASGSRPSKAPSPAEIGPVPHRGRFEALPGAAVSRESEALTRFQHRTPFHRTRTPRTDLEPECDASVHLRHFEGLGRGDPAGMVPGLRATGAGAVAAAHSRALRAGRNPGIMQKRSFNGGHDPAPMCADPPQRTREPDDRTRQPTGKRTILRENGLRPAAALLSHVQHRRRPPLSPTLTPRHGLWARTPRTLSRPDAIRIRHAVLMSPTPSSQRSRRAAAPAIACRPPTPHTPATDPPRTGRRLRRRGQTLPHCLRCTDTLQSRAGTAPISANPARWLHPAQVGL